MDININEVLAIGNKVLAEEDREYIRSSLAKIDLELVEIIPFDRSISRADALRIAPLDYSPSSPAIEAIINLKRTLLEKYE